MGNEATSTEWRDLAFLAADLAFETDAEGRFVLLEPETVLGWTSVDLIGQPADTLLPDTGSGFDPFRPGAPVRRRRVQLRTAEGNLASLLVSATPLQDSQGTAIGARGLAIDITRQDARDTSAAGERRRGEVLQRILERMRQETHPSRRMQAALEGTMNAIGAEGIAVAEIMGKQIPVIPRHRFGTGSKEVLIGALSTLDMDEQDVIQTQLADQRPALACPAVTRFGERIALAAWRAPASPAFTLGDQNLLGMVAGVIGAILEHEAIQREMARQIRNDPLTGLLNRRAFLDEALRRIDRLDREGLSGTLMLIDLDDFAPLGRLGPEAGDEALCIMARILRAAVRPADLVARLGGGGFAAWMDGADELTGAERAEMLRVTAPQELTQLAAAPDLPLTISIGIACRRPGRGEELDSLMRRAGLALEDARHGNWRVSHDEPS